MKRKSLKEQMEATRTWQYMAWITIIFIISIAASWGFSRQHSIPESIDNGAVRHSAKGVYNDL